MHNGRIMFPVAVVTAGRRWKSSWVFGMTLLVFEKMWRRPLFGKSYERLSA